MLYIEADPSGAENWKLEPVIKLLKEGAVGVIPTDTVYVLTLLFYPLLSNFDGSSSLHSCSYSHFF